jgi:hypothetical protein
VEIKNISWRIKFKMSLIIVWKLSQPQTGYFSSAKVSRLKLE